ARTGQRKFEAGWTKPPVTISNGPFILTVWRFKRDMRMEQNPHYWNRAALNIASISIPSIEDGNADVLAYRSGAVDLVTDVAVDRRAICDTVRRTGETPAGTLVPSGTIANYRSPKGLPFDPGAARSLLAEAGWPDPSKFPEVEILFNKEGGHDKIAEAVGRMW